MILFIALAILIALFFIIPKGTNLHEVLRVPYYNYKAQTAKKNDMLIEKHSFGNHRRQYFMLFLPKDGPVSKNQVIVFIHGGGWTFGNPMMFRCNAQLFVDQGYAVVMPTYRRLPFFNSLEMQKDAEVGLKKVTQILQAKGLGDKKLILGGLSSGGHLAGLLAYNQKGLKDIGISRDQLAGILLLAAPLDLTMMKNTPVLWRLAGNRNSNLFKISNPVNHLKENESVPVLIVHGTNDGLVNYKSALSFVEKHGPHQLTFHTIKNGTHMDSGYWIFFKNETRSVIFKWLEGLEVSIENKTTTYME
jgi:acetyl esterase/lipase